jgi:hypothetical protein
MTWTQVFHLGDLSLTLPTGGAITAWLLAGRAWRVAIAWSLAFGLALALVAANKIAFMGWAAGVPYLDFKAASGHATGVTAVFPTLGYLMAAGRPPRARALAAGSGLALAVVVAAALVHAGEHTLAEAVAGLLIGGGVFLLTVHLAGDVAPPPAGRAIACAALAFLSIAWLLHGVPFAYFMIKAALVLSGNATTTSWNNY